VGELVGELEPPEGWWHEQTGVTLREAARTLRTCGVEDRAIVKLLGDVVTAIRDEYGD
jgi:hypothetical protein